MEYPNVIFIVIDTLREDYSTSLKENLKKLGFVEYSCTIAPASWTVPSHASIFTGLYPALHKAHETKHKKGFGIRLKYDNTLSKILSSLGYNTYLFTANPYIRPSLGFGGFDYFYEMGGWSPRIPVLSYDDFVLLEKLKRKANNNTMQLVKTLLLKHPTLLMRGVVSKVLSPLNRVYEKVVAHFMGWPLDKGANRLIKLLKGCKFDKNSPNFIFINLLEVHEPYFLGDNVEEVRKNLLTRQLNTKYVIKWRQMYPKEVEYVSQKIVDILGILKEKGIFDNSLIIITSDHGQLLGEHGRIGHGTFLYDELLRVPLLIKYPKDSQIKVTKKAEEYVSLVSLKPFILNFIENKISDDSILYSKTVFAESYGIGGVTVNPKTEEEKRNVNELEKYRIAIYYKNFKGIFNITDWKFEEIISYNPEIEVTEDIVKHMKKEVVKFLKTVTVAKVPKIKI
ncbi:hypothetical protein PNA2_1025 [Pyrococcus sp. NA2]|uniref:sulfatase-like hydrolase/transferase n=1 Tax=Pyrococcus sp. (strain NA2) TaxID=342949 RepID=UPI000209AA00|nr:sulfatase-like hydrolase/transferase [Pyrococcus sp. NA2]AEC51941.1 hypothetical protein PNA2_1025 [Pyrococcus sp. NA2]